MYGRAQRHPEHREPTAPGVRQPRMSDRLLMDRIRTGHRPSFGILLERYWDPLGRYATGLLGCEFRAEEVVQEAFMRVWERRREWEPSGSVSSYLYEIVRNLSLNRKRDREARWDLERERVTKLPGLSSPPTPSEAFAGNQLFGRAKEAIDALSPRRREVFVLARFHGCSYQEIAHAMDIAPQTVANHMSTALAELREVLTRHTGGV